MKKTFAFIIAVLLTASAFSQQRNPSKDVSVQVKKNELKLNLPLTIFLLHPEITYERIINEDFSVGGSLGFNPGSNEYPINLNLAPFARWYFSGSSSNLQKYGAGFFIELNSAVFARDDSNWIFNNDIDDEMIFRFAAGLGIAFGWKYLSSNNWATEIYLGGGRDFVNNSAYPRMGITIGKRF